MGAMESELFSCDPPQELVSGRVDGFEQVKRGFNRAR